MTMAPIRHPGYMILEDNQVLFRILVEMFVSILPKPTGSLTKSKKNVSSGEGSHQNP